MSEPEDIIDLINKATLSVDMLTSVIKVTAAYLESRMSAEVAMANICDIMEKGNEEWQK